MADGSGGASTGVPVYFHLVVTGVTAVDNNGIAVVTALSMDLVVATSAVVTATTATPLLPVVVVYRRIGQWKNGKMAAIIRKLIVGRLLGLLEYRRIFRRKTASSFRRWVLDSTSWRGRSSNSGRRRIQWGPGAVPGRWSISEGGRSSNSGHRRI